MAAEWKDLDATRCGNGFGGQGNAVDQKDSS
jgi:hypothetical protein